MTILPLGHENFNWTPNRFMKEPTDHHYTAAKRVLKYLKGSLNHGIHFTRFPKFKLIGYSESDWAGNIDDSKSTSGYVFTLGNGPFSWNTHKQSVVAQSSAEAKYIYAASASNQAIWLRKLLTDLQFPHNHATNLFVDNKSAISITKILLVMGKRSTSMLSFTPLEMPRREKRFVFSTVLLNHSLLTS
ncbi:Copia-like retrotransposable element, putative [Theobroma cacao]|uniref:Copia-like retrotransposable element, putative n=1 Tax=Theobroma cacao TaxID=3641 RepID=A0A061DM46_THECC|nr:Copia-like retrotransposable element, putative [Theobroma cacao]